MRRFVMTSAVALVALALVVSPAFAITGNWVDDNEHPFVGLAVFYNADGDFIWRCSGSQHDPVSGYPDDCAAGTLGTLCATSSQIFNYGFANFAGFPNTHDTGLVILDQPIAMAEYGELASAGTLDALGTARGKKDTTFTVSGYGLTYRTQEHSAVPNISFRSRLMANSTLVNLNSANNDGYNLQTQGNGDDRGGTCSGDSGGPVFLGGTDSNKIVAVTSFGLNALCRGTDFAYRVDRQEVLDWIDGGYDD